MSKEMKADESSKFATINNSTSYIAGKKNATKEDNTAVVVNLYNAVLQQQPNHPGHADNWKVTRVTDPTK